MPTMPAFSFKPNAPPVFGTISGPASASASALGGADDSENVFRRPQPKTSSELFDHRSSISGVSFGSATQPAHLSSASAPAIAFGTTGSQFSMRKPSPVPPTASFPENAAGANRVVAAPVAIKPDQYQQQNERLRGEAVANAILVEKIANMQVSGGGVDGVDGGGGGRGDGSVEKGR